VEASETKMATLIDSPEFTGNEIYEIQATDPVQGAASGASFGGIGVSNQPHQQLANRTAFLKNRQDTNVASIAALQAFMAAFAGSLQPSGYVKIPIADVSRGSVVAAAQWGFYSLIGQTASALKNAAFSISFPVAFTNLCLWAGAAWGTDSFTGAGAFVGGTVALETGGFSKAGFNAFSDYDNAANINVSNGSSQQGITGIYWLAIGF
jgi:hypothetical protein